MFRPTRLRLTGALVLSAGMLLQAASLPAISMAAVPNVPVSVVAVPSFVTIGHYVAFDVDISNDSGANVAQAMVSDVISTPSGGTATYMGTIVRGGTAAVHTTCTQTGEFSCSIGNFSAGETLSLRVVYRTPLVAGTLYATFIGTSTGQPSSDPNKSHGDTFSASLTVTMSDPFTNGSDLSTAGYVPTGGEVLETSIGSFGPTNPMWTRLTVPAAAVSDLTFGTTAFLQEGDNGSFHTTTNGAVPCPIASGCYGQTSQVRFANGTLRPAAFQVEILVDNAKKFTAFNKWQIAHISDDGTGMILPTCGGTVTVNCVLSKAISSADKNDYTATLLLDQNGWIRNG